MPTPRFQSGNGHDSRSDDGTAGDGFRPKGRISAELTVGLLLGGSPAAAAIDEAVSVVKRAVDRRAAGFVNAVLH